MIFGTETEYGISTPTHPTLSPIITSTHAVVAFSQGQGARSPPNTPCGTAAALT